MTDIGPPLSEQELCPDSLLSGQEAAHARDVARLRRRRCDFVEVACPACAADKAEPALEKHGFDWVRCTPCGTLYMNPRPSELLLAEYYATSENYQYWAANIYPASEAARRDKIHKPWLERVLGYCTRFDVPRGTLVEVGAGFGTFASVATESGAFGRVVAIEPTPALAAACRARGVDVVEKRIEEVGPEVERADVLCSFEVIEHLYDPARFIERCAALVRPGGLLVLSCPNAEGFEIATLGAVSWAVDVVHLNLFNPGSLRHLVSCHGFEPVDLSTPGRLDAEFVRDAARRGEVDLSAQPFLRRVLLDEWDQLGWPFQQFLAERGLSAHMWLAARRV
jgi:2-polyprenyl-3-methyl-5-hydroxy-6-metoxy-1,4-benzoquinol methylase